MADLKNKYSDPELDPANKDFEEIVNRPDMRALDDQGNAIARDLKNAEGSPQEPSSTSGDSVRDAEKAGDKTPENQFNYQKSSVKTQGNSGWSRRRKVATGAGVGGGLGGIILALIFTLIPLKLPGILDMIVNETGQRVEQITEKRAKTILGRAILSKFGTHTGIVITGDGALSTLIASMRESKFEKKLAAKGLTIEQSGSDGVRIRINNELLENGRTLRTDADVLRAMDGNKLTNKLIKDIVKEEIPSWRWMKRAKFAKWMRIKYGIPRFGIENNSTEEDSEKRAQELQKARLEEAYANTANNALDAFDCVMGEDCVADNLGDSSPGDDTKASGNTDEIDASIREAGNEVADANSKGIIGKATEKLTQTLIGKIGAKAIPIVGWIDLAATLDHIAYEALDNDYFSKLPAYFRGLQYAQLFGSWSGYSDQQKLGALDNAIAGPLAVQLDGAEESQAFNYINGDASKGTPVKLKVNSNNPSEIKEFWDDYKNTIGNIPGTPGNKTSHFILNIYYETIGGGGALGWLSDKAGGFLAKLGGLFTPESAEEWMKNMLTKGLSKMMDLFGLTIDPLDAGPDLFNNLHAGGTVSFNDYCNDIGCRKLTPEQTALMNSQIASERAQDVKGKGVAYALFSPENTKSLTSQLAFALPTPETMSVSTIITDFGQIIANTPSRLASLMTSRSSATAYVDLYGVDPYGATADDLNEPLTAEFARGDECTETVEEGSFDTCAIDTEVAEAMICEFEPESEQCGEDIAGTTTGEGIDFTVGSYNILHSDSHADKSKAIGGCNNKPATPDDPNCARTRAALQAKIITGQVRGIPAFDIVGTQETSPDQYRILKELLPNYAAFPKDASRIHNQLDGAVALFWNTEKFTEFASGKFDSLSNVLNKGGDGKITNPWVGLQASNGQKVYVTTVHYATETFGGTREKMIESAQKAIDWVKTVVEKDSVVMVVGDMNDRLSDKLTYCVFTRDGMMQHARDMMNGLSPGKECPAPNNVGVSIDHIYATPTEGLSVTKWADPPKTLNSILSQASDHTPVYAKFSIAGDEATNLNIATFNILHVGTSPFEQQWRERLPTSIDVLKKNSIGVAGLQEVRPQQHELLTSKSYSTDTYDIFPKTAQQPNFSPNPVIWDKSMYKLVSGKTLPIEYDSGSTIDHAVLVQLEDNSGNQFYVLNTHDPANARPGSDEQNALSRLHNAQYYKQYLGDLAKEGKPIFLTGDFNSGYTMNVNQKPYNNQAENLTYCVISSGGVLKNVWDIFENYRFTCPRKNSPGPPIDHIYTANTYGVSKVWTAPDHQNGSDHPTLMATVALAAGSESSRTNGEWAWPVDKKWWNSNRADFLGAHPGTGTAWGEDKMGTTDKGAGIGADVGDPPDGSPVYAMLGGTVTSTNLCGSNDGIAIKSKVGNATVGISYMHGTNKKFNVGETVKAGDQIMNIGTVGCNVTGGHVHIGIAYNGKYVCPQDVFIAMGKGDSPNLANLVTKARSPCGR